MRPIFTSKHTIAMPLAASRSFNNLSLNTLLVFELRAIVSIYKSAKFCFAMVVS